MSFAVKHDWVFRLETVSKCKGPLFFVVTVMKIIERFEQLFLGESDCVRVSYCRSVTVFRLKMSLHVRGLQARFCENSSSRHTMLF